MEAILLGMITTAVSQVNPWCVESAPGIKDAAKMKAFIRQARGE